MHDDVKKEEALAQLLVGTSLRDIAKNTGVPRSTISRWSVEYGVTRGERTQTDLIDQVLRRIAQLLEGQKKEAKTLTRKSYLVYFVQEGEGLIKIGKTVDIERRMSGIQTHCPNPIRLLAYMEGGTRGLEGKLHRLFKDKRVRGEWFDLTLEDIQSIPGNYGTVHFK